MFDLPVMTDHQRRIASAFRIFLKDHGFEMSQYSVYFRFIGERDKMKRYIRLVQSAVPDSGNVSLLFFTDRQFSEIINIRNRQWMKTPEKPTQLALF